VNRAVTLQRAIDGAANGATICFEPGAAYGCEGWDGAGANITNKNLAHHRAQRRQNVSFLQGSRLKNLTQSGD
jgi:hypothetical protein